MKLNENTIKSICAGFLAAAAQQDLKKARRKLARLINACLRADPVEVHPLGHK